MYDQIIETLKELELSKPNGVIISDSGLLILIKKHFPGAAAAAGTGCPVFNRKSLMFYKNLGADRVTLSIALTTGEIESLADEAARIGIELVCFIKNENCINTNAQCTYLHGMFDDALNRTFCKIEKEYGVRDCGGKKQARAGKRLSSIHEDFSDGCGACFLPRFIEAGITKFKIDGRGRSASEKIKDLLFIKKAVLCAEGGRSADAVEKRIRFLYNKIYGNTCSKKCIYS
ncbi:MAG: U32 family peptidase [bacterium]